MSDSELYKERADLLQVGDVIIIHGVDIYPTLQFPYLKATIWRKEEKKGKLYLFFETENNIFVKSKPLNGDELFEFAPMEN